MYKTSLQSKRVILRILRYLHVCFSDCIFTLSKTCPFSQDTYHHLYILPSLFYSYRVEFVCDHGSTVKGERTFVHCIQNSGLSVIHISIIYSIRIQKYNTDIFNQIQIILHSSRDYSHFIVSYFPNMSWLLHDSLFVR